MGSVLPLLKVRNIRVSLALATLNMTFYATLLGFGPLYLVNVAGLSNAVMATTMTGVGVVGVGFAFVGPMLSDRIGRKPVLIGAYAIAIAGVVLLAAGGNALLPVIAGSLLATAGGSASGALIMAIIPGECAPLHLKGTAMGFCAAVGEMLGAVLMPIAIGWGADRAGLAIVPWVLLAVGVLFCLLALVLTESAPKAVARKAAMAA